MLLWLFTLVGLSGSSSINSLSDPHVIYVDAKTSVTLLTYTLSLGWFFFYFPPTGWMVGFY